MTLASGSELQNNGQISSSYITMGTGSTFMNSDSVTGTFELEDDSTLINSGTMNALNRNSWNVGSATIDNTGTINMGANAISATGNLALLSVGTITGSGNAVISLGENGALTLGKANDSTTGTISNTGGGCAIAVAGASTITWNNTGVTISTETGLIGNTIQGLTETTDNGTTTINKPDYLTLPTGCELAWSEKTLSLSTN